MVALAVVATDLAHEKTNLKFCFKVCQPGLSKKGIPT
jgi:hypothetical protein